MTFSSQAGLASIRGGLAWNPDMYRTEQLAGALLDTECPRCGMRVGARVINGPDGKWAELECPACLHRFEEET